MKKLVFNIFAVLFSAFFLSASCYAQSMEEKAEKGDLEAQLTLCTTYSNGIGAKYDEEKAFKWCKKAADQGNAEAQIKTAGYYVDKKDYNQAMSLFKKAADSGNAYAQDRLGGVYIGGQYGVPKDMAMARSWFEKAAERGNYLAQLNLADMYYKGKGGARDIERAKRWYQKAADQGYERAWDKLNEINSENK